MYYNLKIVTKDSEFSLESTDKTIIQREMDIYFASLYGASEHFVSQIKEIKIEKPQTTVNNIQPKPSQTAKPNINSSDIQKIVQKAIKESTKALNNVVIPSEKKGALTGEANKAALEALEKINETAINDIFLNQNKEIEAAAEKAKSDFEKHIQSDNQGFAIDNEFEKEAEALYMELQNQVKNEAGNPKEEIGQPALENEFEIPKVDIPILGSQNEVPQTVPFAEEQKSDTTSHSQDAPLRNTPPDNKEELMKKINSATPYQDIINEYKEKGINTHNYSRMLEKQLASANEEMNQAQAPFETPQETAGDIEESQTTREINTQNINFNAYLGGYAADKIEDEFLICASYIRNILKQNDFTMKYINSKLFQATGKIADTSVVDELIKKEYINNVPSDDFAKYAITDKGDNYLNTIKN